MLKYEVKLDYDNLKRDTLVWSEKYVAPDLSFVSGVTSQHYHIDRSETIAASIGGDSNFASLNIECKNVTRNGYALISNKQYKIEKGKTSTDNKSFDYIYVNGVYYYINGKNDESADSLESENIISSEEVETVTVHNHLKEQWKKVNGEYKVEIVEGDVTGTVDRANNIVKLDTIVWIEDDMVTIDGNEYIYDKDEEGLKYYPGGRTLNTRYDSENKLYEITPCDDISFIYFEKESDYIHVTKFKLTKKSDKTLGFDRLSYCTYFYYALYREYYCPIRRSGTTTSFKYVCDVPTRLINGNPRDTTTTSYDVKNADGTNITVTRISQLKSTDAVVTISGTKFPVEYLLQNSNYGDELAVYLTDGSDNISIGDVITLTYQNDGVYDVPVYNVSGEEFVLFKNVKYALENNIANTAVINGVEYDVSYPNGTDVGSDALVNIDGDMIPMKITSSGLERYGYIVLKKETTSQGKPSDDVGTAKYSVKSYQGVRINGKVYRVYVDSEDSSKHIQMSEPTPYEFIVDNIEGSSLLICTPKFNSSEFVSTFIDSMCAQICDYFVGRQDNVVITSENRAFGTRVIDSNIGYVISSDALSSNDYYDATDTLTLFVNSGYIQIPLPLAMNVALNGMQEDIVKKEFYTVEKEKAINPIVDMEKDVYVPKYINDKYVGSSTDFLPINQIEVNLHFRTRDMDNWKVNDANNNISSLNDMDNWFCTDFFPYNKILELPENGTDGNENKALKDSVMSMSDIMYLLWFTNDDIYYQRDKVGKSFLRFSYYDSPDPNTQSLLATSTVFMDEHTLYKKYVDYSRRNIYNFGLVTSGVTYKETMEREDTDSYNVINRISVKSEYLGNKGMDTIKTYDVNYITRKDEIGSDIRKILKEDSRRLSSRFTIDNKYATDTSSEGFYLYIFREYSENLHPKPIYMKIEFNHAGVGRTIPFIVPMHWSGSTDNPNEMFPERRLTLYDDDIDELKKGYPLSFVYAQAYIPLYAVYDFKKKEYAYVFDDRYVTVDENSKLILNLFELKVTTENEATDKDRADVRNNNIMRATIDVNKQFIKKGNESNSEGNQP